MESHILRQNLIETVKKWDYYDKKRIILAFTGKLNREDTTEDKITQTCVDALIKNLDE